QNSPFGIDGSRAHRAMYTVETTSNLDMADVVRKAPALPIEGSACPWDTGAVAVSVDPKQDPNSKTLWRVTVRWQKAQGAEGDGPNPWDKPVLLRWNGTELAETWARDLEGKAFVNSAGDPFNPPPMIIRPMPILIARVQAISYSHRAAVKYGNSTNSDTWLSYPPNSWKALFAVSNEQRGADTSYWIIDFRFILNFDFDKGVGLWHPTLVADIGNRFVEAAAGVGDEPVFAKDKNGIASSRPIPLDTEGVFGPKGGRLPPVLLRSGDVQLGFIPFTTLHRRPFANLLTEIAAAGEGL
ncbi:unnamed protein product, partial [marine sediment metagenome]